ncbi:UNVERIFIED_ORG: hypothetical protein M2414_004799 [Rahnella aquatilis]
MLKKLLLVCFIFSGMQCGVFARESSKNTPGLTDVYTAERDAYGRFIAEQTFILYSLSSDECAGPAYRCRGIMISAFEANDAYWMQPYPVLSKISLSYWTKRTTGKTRYNAAWLGAGFMLWPPEVIDKLSGGNVFEPEYTCVFATEGMTGGSLQSGCGGYGDVSWPKCQDRGIYNAREYSERYGRLTLNKCGFTLGVSLSDDALAFESAQELQLSEIKNYGGTFYNEVLIRGWPSYNPAKIPLLGFFYIKGHPALQPEGYREITQKSQSEFYKITHIFVPVIRVSGSDWEHVRFEYRVADQSADIPAKVIVNANMLIIQAQTTSVRFASVHTTGH